MRAYISGLFSTATSELPNLINISSLASEQTNVELGYCLPALFSGTTALELLQRDTMLVFPGKARSRELSDQ
jgi:hypothetical protein